MHHLLADAQRGCHSTSQVLALSYSLMFCLQVLGKGNNLNILKLMSGLKNYYIFTIEYYSTIKKYQIMNFADKWIEIKIIILNEITQTQKEKNHVFTFI